MGRLTGKVAIITGASQGMGEAHALRFVEEGAKVIATDVNAGAGEALGRKLGANGVFIRHDVSRAADWASVLKEGEERFGTVNVLINNAGILGPLEGTDVLSEESFLNVCAVNQLGVFLGMRTVLPSMQKAGVGSIVNVSSIAGIVAIMGVPNLAYVASKFAVRGMSKQVAIEYGAKNIRVNSVHPGYIRTPMMAAATDEDGGGAVAHIALGRLAHPNEVSSLMVFLASDESSFITGTEQIIDGGMTAA